MSTLFFVIIQVRINSGVIWFLPWLQWNFSGSENQERNVSLCLDVFGYSYYISLLIAPLPGLLIVAIQKLTKSAKSNAHALNCLLLLVVILSATISTQSTGKDTPIWNPVLMTIEYSFLRTVFFITRSMVWLSYIHFLICFFIQYLFEYFPSEHFSALFSLMNIPCGVASFVIDPLFNYFILNGDKMANATFGPGFIVFVIQFIKNNI